MAKAYNIGKIKPVQSGYRWVLTYNLVNTSPSSSQSAAGLDTQTNSFVQALSLWRDLSSEGPLYLVSVLDHLYTEKGLNLTSLKGDDYCRVRHVAESSKIAGDFYVFLASMEKHQKEISSDDGRKDEEDSRLMLKVIVGLDSLEAFSLKAIVLICNECLLQQWIYESRSPDAQTRGGYVGNEYANPDQIYTNSVS